MLVKYMIHRGESSFANEKTFYEQATTFFKKEFPSLKLVTKDDTFCIQRGDLRIDFDYGYLDLENKNFSAYDYVISSGLCAVLNPAIQPGSILIPASATPFHINKNEHKATITPSKQVTFSNPMNALIQEIHRYELSNQLKAHISQAHQEFIGEQPINALRELPVHKNAQLLAASSIFIPSELTNYTFYEEQKPLNNLETHLTTTYDALNCESHAMIKHTKNKLFMYTIGIDKPYEGKEFQGEIRDERKWQTSIPEMNLATIYAFKYTLLALLIRTQGNILAKNNP